MYIEKPDMLKKLSLLHLDKEGLGSWIRCNHILPVPNSSFQDSSQSWAAKEQEVMTQQVALEKLFSSHKEKNPIICHENN